MEEYVVRLAGVGGVRCTSAESGIPSQTKNSNKLTRPGWSIGIKGSASAGSVTAMIWLLASLGVIALGILVVYATGFSV